MAWFPCKVGGSGGIPAQLQTDMDAVLNKKFGTTGQTYPSTDWADDVNIMGLLPVRSASGAIASFSDGADAVPIKSGKFTFNAVQASGTPTPSVPIPISGFTGMNIYRTGKNLFDPSTVFTATGSYMYAKNIFPKNTNLICKFVDKDPTVDISGIYFGFYDDTYTSGAASSGHYRWLINNGTVQSNLSNAATGDGSVLCDGLFAFPKNQTTIDTVLARFDIQVEVGTVSTDYVAYSATTYPVTWSEEGTIYGGYVKVNADGSAELWKTHELLDLGDLSWVKDSTTYSYTFFYSSTMDVTNNNLMADHYKVAETSSIFTSDDNVIRFVDTTTIRLRIKDSSKNALTGVEFKSAVAGYKIRYELETPVKVCDLTDININTLLGTNNIFHDANGDSEVEYRQMGTVIWNGEKKTTAFSTPITFDGIDISQYTYIQLTFYAFKNGVSYTYNDLTVKVSDIPKNAAYESTSDILQIAGAGSGSTLYGAYVRRDLNDMLYVYFSTNYTNVAVLLKGA